MWVTLGNDAVRDVQAAIASGAFARSATVDRAGNESTVLRLEDVDPSEISRLMHSKYGRCGGFVFHESENEALLAAGEQRTRYTVRQTLASYTIDNEAAADALVASVKASNILETITFLSSFKNRYYSTSVGETAAKSLFELYKHTWKQPSVIMTVTGSVYPDEIVVIGGHLDSTAGWAPGENTSAPGADDDASGIATLTEVARAVLESGFTPARTIKFIGYSAEEVGLRGSNDIAKKFIAEGRRVVGVMQLDMTNYQDATGEMTLVSDYTNEAQNEFVGALIDRYVKQSWSYMECGYACSDHASWTSAGVAASFPFEAANYNPKIHTAGDTLENSDRSGEHALKFAKLGVAYVAEFAKGALPDVEQPTPAPTPEPESPQTAQYTGDLAPEAALEYGPFEIQADHILDVVLTGTGDADLSVRFDAPPTDSLYDCHPYSETSAETCVLPPAARARKAYVRVSAFIRSSFELSLLY
jgi:bacterial leucyl aminopeptidase